MACKSKQAAVLQRQSAACGYIAWEKDCLESNMPEQLRKQHAYQEVSALIGACDTSHRDEDCKQMRRSAEGNNGEPKRA